MRGRELTIERFTVDHAQVAQASGRASFDFENDQPLRSLTLHLAGLQFPGAYESYLQPLLLDTNFKAMQTAGRIAGEIEVVDGAPRSVELVLEDLTFDDGARTFAMESLAGAVHWRSDPQAKSDDSVLRWNAGAILGLAMGASELQFNGSGRQFRLLQPARIPLLDGALALESLRIRNAGLPSVAFMVDATLRADRRQTAVPGVRLARVRRPRRRRHFQAAHARRRRDARHDAECASVRRQRHDQRSAAGAAARQVAAFLLQRRARQPGPGADDGRVLVRSHHRSACPAAIDGLRLFNWAPVAFDARLYTPPGDRSKHRISQRAVENIGSIGGGGAGVTAALSSGFLRFFDDFNYERLGLSCRLENEVCAMDGVAPGAERRLLPREGQRPAAHRRHRQLAARRLAAAGAAADRGDRSPEGPSCK